jgi:hypothetical protein
MCMVAFRNFLGESSLLDNIAVIYVEKKANALPVSKRRRPPLSMGQGHFAMTVAGLQYEDHLIGRFLRAEEWVR